MNRFRALLAGGGPIVADGGMGTMLMAAGLVFGDPPEEWNLRETHAGRVRAIHRGYYDAGAHLVLTNSFGGSPFRLKLHRLDDRVVAVNRAAAELARAEAGPDRVVAGSIGPSGELFVPLGELDEAAAIAGFRDQAAGLAAGGADVLWIETMSDLQEVRAAVAGARQAAPELPIVATMTFDTRGHTMMGVSPGEALAALAALGLAAVGANCGNGTDEIETVIDAMRQADAGIPLIAKSNAGMPELVDGQAVYRGTPAVMAEYARRVHALGATIIGACCGSTPAHIAAIAATLRHEPPLDREQVRQTLGAAATRGAATRGRRARRGEAE
jgi:methionine synthase I (cobalamin-dependent)